MKALRGGNNRRLWATAVATALLLVIGGVATSLAEASTLRVTVNGTIAQRRRVTVQVVGKDLGRTATRVTGDTGVVSFAGLPGDTYTVTPSRYGFRFQPAARLLALANGVTMATTFVVSPLPAVGSLAVSETAVSMAQTLSTTIVVTALTGAGDGIAGAPVHAASSAPYYVKVTPAVATTDALGRAVFTLTAFGSLAFSNPAPEVQPVVATATINFASGGWRGTTVRRAQTLVSVTRALEGELWVTSGHADANGEPFSHWDKDGAIPTSCARCHSKPGYLEYVATGAIANPVPVGTVVDCLLCHDPTSFALTQVTFPSGVTVTGLGHESICSTCHQGRESSVSVDRRLAGKPEDTIDTSISFTNIHYFAAAATMFGGVAKGGYQYPGQVYDQRLLHVSAANVCQECHNPHSLALDLQLCRTCHPAAVDYAGVKTIRMAGSTQDYDGDGNVTEGMAAELAGVAAKLYEKIQEYGTAQGFPIVYDAATYPYFLYAADRTGYKSFTPRLLKACYNYQVYQKDPGTHAHNPKYLVEIMYDSIQSLASFLPSGPVAGLARNDLNHFDAASEAFRHWDNDADGLVDAACTRCHSGEAGFRYYIENGFTNSPNPLPPASRMSCETCHTGTNFASAPPLRLVSQVTFPSPPTDPTTILNDPLNPDESFICITCHQGRESKKTIDVAIGTIGDDVMDPSLKFLNVHYLSAGASLYGKQAGVGYEYPGMTYALKFNHWGGQSAWCAYCHDITATRHTFLPRLTPVCANCHTEITGGDIETIRLNRPYDYDGDGNTAEKLIDEIHGLRDDLYTAMRGYARTTLGFPIAYSQTQYPYFFNDANDNGIVDPGETSFDHWTPRLLKGAHNFQMAFKEPGDWAHNTNYTAQIMIDSIRDLNGGAPDNYQRPVGF
ncbi:MAG TPA: hypothetical protein VI078_07535 [bacterium]